MSKPLFLEFLEMLDEPAFPHRLAIALSGMDDRALSNAASRGTFGEGAFNIGKGKSRSYTGRQVIEAGVAHQFLGLSVPPAKAFVFARKVLACGVFDRIAELIADPSPEQVRKLNEEMVLCVRASNGEFIFSPVTHSNVESLHFTGFNARIFLPVGQMVFTMAKRYGVSRLPNQPELRPLRLPEKLSEDEWNRLAAMLDDTVDINQ